MSMVDRNRYCESHKSVVKIVFRHDCIFSEMSSEFLLKIKFNPCFFTFLRCIFSVYVSLWRLFWIFIKYFLFFFCVCPFCLSFFFLVLSFSCFSYLVILSILAILFFGASSHRVSCLSIAFFQFFDLSLSTYECLLSHTILFVRFECFRFQCIFLILHCLCRSTSNIDCKLAMPGRIANSRLYTQNAIFFEVDFKKH